MSVIDILSLNFGKSVDIVAHNTLAEEKKSTSHNSTDVTEAILSETFANFSRISVLEEKDSSQLQSLISRWYFKVLRVPAFIRGVLTTIQFRLVSNFHYLFKP